ncbi:MAG: EutN/CcmL family microcompartment protein [Pirellulales bacterium]
MRIAEVIGTVTLNRTHPSFPLGALRLAVPLTLTDLLGQTEPAADTLVVFDEFGAGAGSFIAVSDGAEAAQPFHPDGKPVDAYNAAILDRLHLDNTTNT